MTTTTTRPQRRRNTPPPHGDHRRYKYWECRCDQCREAKRLYDKRLREGRAKPLFVDPTGTVRRMRALVAAGYTYPDMAEHLGCHTRGYPARLAAGATGPRGVLLRTAEQVRRMTDEMLDRPRPEGPCASYARTVAARNGWYPIEAWGDVDNPDDEPYAWCRGEYIDDVLVQRALDGEARWRDLNDAERAEVIRRAGSRPLTAIARDLHVSWSTFQKFAAQVRQAA